MLYPRPESEADMETSIDRAGSLVNGYGEMLLADLKSSGDTPRPAAYNDTAHGWTVLVIACPVPAGERVPGLNPCAKDVLTLLASTDEPLSAARIRKAMEKEGIGVHAQITVRRALQRLRDLRLVSLSRCRPK